VHSHTTELLQRNHRLIELLILVRNDLLFLAFSNDHASITPTELVHAPERIDWEEEAVYRVSDVQHECQVHIKGIVHDLRENVDHHPSDKHEFALNNEDNRLKSMSV